MTGPALPGKGGSLRRAVNAQHWDLGRSARIAVTVLAVVSLLDSPRDAGLFDGGPPDWWKLVAIVTGYVCLGLAPWRTGPAVWVSAVPLVIALGRGGGSGVEPFVLVPCLIAVAVTGRLWQLWALAAAYSAWATGFAIVIQDSTGGWIYGLVIFAGAVAGLAVRYFAAERSTTKRRLADLEAENQLIRADERELLARELHDVVAHELSIISLQVMAHGDADDPAELRTAMKKVDQASKAALTELRALIGVLRDLAPADSPKPLLTELGLLPVDTTVERVIADLRAHGFDPQAHLDLGTGLLNATTQNTVSRVIQEASTNILRYARPDSPCSFSISSEPEHLTIQVSSALSRSQELRQSWQSSGWGLRGLKERVELTGGHLQAGPVGDSWHLAVTIPSQNASLQ